ncbi:aminoglycoside adenylyltransferase domain-containing protein [Actinokineospora iranica]|uniref:Uncharacterized protein n=1 Tax=Actinokineospora iranica TaxID=1271860 RepID=A0A1G6S2R7_9PSEU|nr:aminoglycoside adenylyltransferase domain-containing protein [Actinokineospora iranica]SDD11200.1 protein of unknown function [Actinokineospora iranica]
MVPAAVAQAVDRYLAVADRLLPGRITGFHLVGSVALGAWRPASSDIDFVAVTRDALGTGESRRLRLLHPIGNWTAVSRAVARRTPAIPGTVNGVFVAAGDLATPVTRIRPVAAHTGRRFHLGRAFDVNPVVWRILLDRGITVRGRVPGELGLDPEPAVLSRWNMDNLNGYWRSWAGRARARKRQPIARRRSVDDAVSWGVLGSSRLHRTIATGEIVSKEDAGEYALDVFASRWRPLIRAALAYRRGEPAPTSPGQALSDPVSRLRLTGEFVEEVIADASRLG